jgi:hypothetical protein
MATDKATLSVLNTFADLLEGASDGAVNPAVLAFFPTVIEVCRPASSAISHDIVEVMETMAAIPTCRPIMSNGGADALLRDIEQRATTSRPLVQRIHAVLAMMNQSSEPAVVAVSTGVAAKKSAAPSTTSAASMGSGRSGRRELQTLQLNMDNLLGNREQEDAYIRALLLLDGVTSVTLDRKREVGTALPSMPVPW